jgi:hypothetical protein
VQAVQVVPALDELEDRAWSGHRAYDALPPILDLRFQNLRESLSQNPACAESVCQMINLHA